MTIMKDGVELLSLRDWQEKAGPKSKDQWKQGRSAMEVARAWLEGGGTELPIEVSTAILAHPNFGCIQSWLAVPEAKLRFDDFPGEPRNSDLVVYAADSHGPYIIGVEAKADEPFDTTVADKLAEAVERYIENSRSNGVRRIEQLAVAMLGLRRPGDPPLKKIRYQLLTACAGALCEAEREQCTRALMLVHEFVTDETDDAKHGINQADLDIFIKRVSHGTVTTVPSGTICGPFKVPGKPLLRENVELFVGKVSRNIRTKSL